MNARHILSALHRVKKEGKKEMKLLGNGNGRNHWGIVNREKKIRIQTCNRKKYILRVPIAKQAIIFQWSPYCKGSMNHERKWFSFYLSLSLSPPRAKRRSMQITNINLIEIIGKVFFHSNNIIIVWANVGNLHNDNWMNQWMKEKTFVQTQ